MIARLAVLILVYFSTLVPFSVGTTDEEYKICSTTSSCGHIKNIRYPFWVDNDKPQYCGSRRFKLNCFNATDYPHLSLGSFLGRFRVLTINTSSHTIVVKRGTNDTCYPLINPDQKLANDHSTSYKLGPSVTNISLFCGCPKETVPRDVSLTCYSLGLNVTLFYLSKEEEAVGHCQNTFTVPVSKRAMYESIHSNGDGRTIESVLEEKFELHYNFPNLKACLACQDSGGICGSGFHNSPSRFVCYYADKRRHFGLILSSGIGGVMLMILLIALCYDKKLSFDHLSSIISRRDSPSKTMLDLEWGSLDCDVPLFSYKDLQEATNNFDQSRELGNGGFGRVYYRKLKDGREVAVKQLYEKSYRRVEQFMNEVQILTRLRHQNLVSLYGCTSPRCKELLLVYEFICNGTLADHLYGEKSNSTFLSWATRMRIAIETATALSYLHVSEIIHRDVKTNNILLDGNFSVKVADFGLSRLFPTDVTHVSTAPQGTPGYLDPEYHQCYQLTVKSDVYSFGVVLIELISSLPPVDMNRQKHEINLSNYAMKRIQIGAFEELVDPHLGFGSDVRIRTTTVSVAELAFRCLQHDKELRPAMDEALEVLKRIEGAEYTTKQLEAKDNDVIGSNNTEIETSSNNADQEDEGATLLKNTITHHQQQHMHPPSLSSVADRWGSESTTASSTGTLSGNDFYSISK